METCRDWQAHFVSNLDCRKSESQRHHNMHCVHSVKCGFDYAILRFCKRDAHFVDVGVEHLAKVEIWNNPMIRLAL